MNLSTFVKLGYAMLILTLILMFWTSMVRMNELPVLYPPCFFNPLCTCSKEVPDLGIVSCHDVPMIRIPQPINATKVFMLHLENNGLRGLEPQFFVNTGLYKLRIRYNPLSDIPDEAFTGLERSLWELELPFNDLVQVPSRSFRHLQKLRLLDLTGNRIYDVSPDSWRGIESSLQILRLADNYIGKLPPDVFSGLTYLEVLDLGGNDLKEIDVPIFREGMAHLTHLYFNDNQLVHVPYAQLSSLKRVKLLDLSYNRIEKMLHPMRDAELRGIQLSLDELRLDYNQVDSLPPESFQHFFRVNKTYLSGNPLTTIKKGAFRDSRIRELYFHDCDLTDISSEELSGLEPSLELLDISGNNVTVLPPKFLHEFDFLRTLVFRENRIESFSPAEIFTGFHYSLYDLDLSGKKNGIVALRDLREMRNLRFLSVSRLSQATLSPDDFLDFGTDVKELRIVKSNLNTIKSHAFGRIREIRYLDFSENSISTIENDAFSEVGHSLLTLKVSHGLSSSVTELPSGPLKSLTNLQYLDFSNNRIKTVSDTSFHFLKRIRRLRLQDNEIDGIKKGTFQGDIHSALEEINLAYNGIKGIGTDTFVDLSSTVIIYLEDNAISSIERRAFTNMNRLRYINLRGNKIRDIDDDAFQNLPDLEFLDLAYNDLEEFNFAWFDQVGTLSSFKVNASHNEIRKLWINGTTFVSPTTIGGNVQSNIKVLDISYNNISDIMHQFFRPVEYSLTHLYLKRNQLTNVTRGVFGNMPHLQWLDLSHNDLLEIDFDCLRNTKDLQVLYFAWNDISEIPADVFRSLRRLRILDLSHNKLRTLPDNIFIDTNLEFLDLSHNQFVRLPIKSMSISSAATLMVLDMSWNSLTGIHSTDAVFRLRDLTWLDLSYNRLVRLDDGVFSDVPELTYLDLSHNKQLILESRGKMFYGIENSLLHLGLSNISLLNVPELPLRRLRSLYLAHNELTAVPPERESNLTSLHLLDLGHNHLSFVPLITHMLPELRILYIGYNPITTITNTTLLGLTDTLEELDLRRLPLATFETGALCKAVKLRTLRMTAYTGIKNFNFPKILEYNNGLRHLHIDVENETNLETEMRGRLPAKLYNFTFTGTSLKSLHADILKGMRSPHLRIRFYNTSVSTIPRNMFQNAETVRNVTVDISESNVRTLENPSTGYRPGLPAAAFLLRLKMAGSRLTCNCDIGWIEMWERKRRQYHEESQCNSDKEYFGYTREDFNDFTCWDNGWDDDLRETLCENKNNMSVSEALRTDIECGWSSADSHNSRNLYVFVLINVLLTTAKYVLPSTVNFH